MTDNVGSNTGWGVGVAAIIGGALGYWAGNARNENCRCNNNGCGCSNGVSAIASAENAINSAKLDSLADFNTNKATLDSIAFYGMQNDNAINALAKDTYQLGTQNLITLSNQFRNVDQAICGINQHISADGTATRAAIQAFQDRYLSDRITDLQAENSQLKSTLALAPISCAVSGIQNTLNSVITGCEVRSCTTGACCGCTSSNS